MSIQLNESDWRPMDQPITFPALVQYDSGQCGILSSDPGSIPRGVLRWQPFTQPELPKKDEFEGWWNSAGFTGMIIEAAARQSWTAATAHANKRFSDGVEKILSRYSGTRADDKNNLRALAKGTS